MANSPVVKIGLTFQDRDSNRAVLTCYCAFATPIEDAYAYALAVASRVGALSDAIIVGFDMVWRWTIDDSATPADSSDISRKILMLMTNDAGDINGLVIPSPAAAIWETIGPYAGIRLDLASAGALAFADMLLAIDFKTEDNRQLGTVLAAGGLAL